MRLHRSFGGSLWALLHRRFPTAPTLPLTLALLLVVMSWVGAGPLVLTPSVAQAQGTRIAVVVNQDAISVYDVEARINLVMRMSGIPDRPEIRERLRQQVVRGLIDEALKRQEAERLGVELSNDEAANALAQVESRNGLPPGGLIKALKQSNVDPETALSQIRADVIWQKAMQIQHAGRINISDVEVDLYLGELQRNLGQPEYLAAEILLPVDTPAEDAEALEAARRMIEQIRGGARFSVVAQQFSQGPTAAQGGDLGWVGPGDMEPELFQALARLTPIDMSEPIRTFGGYHIMLLRDVRVAGADARPLVSLSQVMLPAVPTTEFNEPTLRSIRTELEFDVTSCEDMNNLIRDRRIRNSGTVGPIAVDDLPAEIQGVVRNLPPGQVSEPVTTPEGVLYAMVCEVSTGGVPGREMVRERLAGQRLQDTMQRRLRDLRQQALIDIRI